jgi:hypothetical protein
VNNPRIKDGGLFIEEGITNLYSTNGKNNLSSSNALQQVMVSGDALIEDKSINMLHRIQKNLTGTSGVQCTLSVTLKANGRRYVYLNADAGMGAKATIDLLTGEIVVGKGTAIVADLGDGWYRLSITGTWGTPSSFVFLQINDKFVATDTTYTGDGVSGIFAKDFQFEQKAYPTSYTEIKRPFDNVQIPVSFDKYGGSIDIEFEYHKLENAVQYIFDSNPEERWLIYKERDDSWIVYTGGAGRGMFITKPVEGRNVINVTWTANYIQVYLNGERVINSTHVLAGLQNRVFLGQRYTLGNQLNNTIYSFVVKDHNGTITYQI